MKMNENEMNIGGLQNIYIKYLVSVTSSFICYARIRYQKRLSKTVFTANFNVNFKKFYYSFFRYHFYLALFDLLQY